MIKLEELKEIHIDSIEPKALFNGEEGLVQRLKVVIKSKDSYGVCLIKDGKPIAIFGISSIWKGVAHLWTVTTDESDKHKLLFCKYLLEFYSAMQSKFNFHRAQFSIKKDYEGGKRWAEFLGFTEEAVLKQYGPDKTDYVMYSRLL